MIKNEPRRTSILAVAYEEPRSWPATHPPFRGDVAPVVDGLDRVWLMTRCLTDEQSVCYDVIDRNGARVQRYRLPEKSVVVGFGKNTVYVAVEQKSDKSLLQRYTLP